MNTSKNNKLFKSIKNKNNSRAFGEGIAEKTSWRRFLGNPLFLLNIFLTILVLLLLFKLSRSEQMTFSASYVFSRPPENYTKTTGFYNIDKDYFCVDTKDLYFEKWEQRYEHEMCHALVAKRFNHFCTEDDVVSLHD